MVVPKGGKMKLKTLKFLVYLVFAALFVQNASAMPVWFDFEDVQDPGDAEQIEAYMENIYGSDITVADCILGDGITACGCGLDLYLQPADPTQSFSISFEQVPITAVSFDYIAAPGTLLLYADGVEVFIQAYACDAGNSGNIHFDTPVTTLTFDSSFSVPVIDNLIVNNLLETYQVRDNYGETAPHAPEPATVLLLGIGGAILLKTRKRRL